MIFVTLGSQKFQFNRLLEEIDKLIEQGIIKEEVFAQIGYSDYKPKSYQYKEFLDREEFNQLINKCEKVITHGGTGAIISAVKRRKKVIAIPRLVEYGEHVDNHQWQIVKQFSEMNFISGILDVIELEEQLKKISDIKFNEYKSNTENIMQSIDKYVSKI